jgi:hypothetical protein
MMPLGRRSKCSLHQRRDLLVGDDARAFGVDRDVHRLGHADRVGDLDLALARRPAATMFLAT